MKKEHEEKGNNRKEFIIHKNSKISSLQRLLAKNSRNRHIEREREQERERESIGIDLEDQHR
jgi:hypothetical protein